MKTINIKIWNPSEKIPEDRCDITFYAYKDGVHHGWYFEDMNENEFYDNDGRTYSKSEVKCWFKIPEMDC